MTRYPLTWRIVQNRIQFRDWFVLFESCNRNQTQAWSLAITTAAFSRCPGGFCTNQSSSKELVFSSQQGEFHRKYRMQPIKCKVKWTVSWSSICTSSERHNSDYLKVCGDAWSRKLHHNCSWTASIDSVQFPTLTCFSCYFIRNILSR